jgi:hypothetical protein
MKMNGWRMAGWLLIAGVTLPAPAGAQPVGWGTAD